ncbi:MAG: hypothetical protein JEZ10_04335 [Verrucomicrobia bacterium]|nr:hypothetical protein [Verrucomicrobiota bacterium]
MTPNLLKTLWFLMPACWLFTGLIVWPEINSATRASVSALLALSLLCWGHLTLRAFGFRKRMFLFLRRLLAGDYETGIKTRKRFTDEISHLEALGNQVAERLRVYDRLRADRVSIHARVLDLLLIQSKDGLITANVEKEIFLLNPVAQKMLGVNRKSFSFESVLKPKVNESFNKLFQHAVTGRKINTEGTCLLQLPGMGAPIQLAFLIMPLRDRDENVRFAVLSIESPDTK